MTTLPDHAQVTLDDLRRQRDDARRRVEQLDYAIAGVCLAYGVGDVKDVEAQPKPPVMTHAHVVGFNAEAKLRAKKQRAQQRKQRSPLVGSIAVMPTAEDVLDALGAAPPAGWSVAEVSGAIFPRLDKDAGARAAVKVGHVLDALVAEGRVVKDDRLFRRAAAPVAAAS